MTQEIGDGPIQEEYVQMMTDIARALDMAFNGNAKRDERETGFVLLVFPFHEAEGRCNYISNGGRREDIVAMLKEQIARFEGMPQASGSA
jgi:hypothetical protein